MPSGNISMQREDSARGTTSATDGRKKEPFGGFSFESDSLPDFSEFEDYPSGSETQGDKIRPEAGKMAPVTTIETISISRPLKVIAFLCGFFASVLLLMGLASSEWLISKGYKQGLFVYCLNTTQLHVPFVPGYDPEASQEGCHRLDLEEQAYTLVCGAFCVAALLINIFATLLTVLGLRCRDPNRKYKYYRMGTGVMTIGLVMALVALIVYPIKFSQIISSDRMFVPGSWEFGWAYGVGWGAIIFLFGGILLLLCDKESEEIYYKERTIVQYADAEEKN